MMRFCGFYYYSTYNKANIINMYQNNYLTYCKDMDMVCKYVQWEKILLQVFPNTYSQKYFWYFLSK